METPLLVTKLFVPPARRGLVPRPHLVERLNAALSYGLALVSAPAGFGKTTLLSEWTRTSQPKVPAAWVSLDEGDNDPVRFWDYFIAALQTLQPSCGDKILPWLHSSELRTAEPTLTALINDLSLVKGDLAIILDDYHLIESQQIHEGVVYLIEHLPAQIHLVISARADPPLPLARFRGKGIMLELHTDDLRFTQDETASLLNELKTPRVSARDIAALNERTEGWVVGLKMAALSAARQKDVSGFVAAFAGSQRYVMDYLIEEVLRKQSPELRDFLMKTSVLERLTAPLCDAVTGRQGSHDIILNLERSHLFIVPLDESRRWYRYEHLFADLLRHQCAMVWGAEPVAALHRQASQWYEDNDLPDDAVHHALEARDWPRAMRLIYAHHEAHRKLGEFNTLLRWFQAIPDEVLRGDLRLYSRYADVAAYLGRLDTAEAAVSYLESAAHDAAQEGEIAFSRAMLYERRGDTKRYLELCEKAFALLAPDDVAMRSRVAFRIAHVRQRLGHLLQAEEWASRALELGQRSGDISAITGSLGQVAIVASYQGKLKRAAEVFKKAIELAEEAESPLKDYAVLSMVQYITNDLEGAAENARLAVECGELSGQVSQVTTGLYYQAKICLANGDVAGAAAAIVKMDGASRHPSIDSFWYADYVASRVMCAVEQGDLDEAAAWGEQLPDITGMLAIDWHVPARLLLAQGKKVEAARLLRELYERSIQLGAPLLAVRMRVCQALATEDEGSALEFLAEALTTAEPDAIIRFFVDEGKLLRPLLDRALAQEITPAFTRKLLDIIEDEERRRKAGKRAAAPSTPLSLLSERELEVLRLLADDIPNQRISQQLMVSLGTVKTHVHHIIEKLEVKNRRQAVQRARALKLL